MSQPHSADLLGKAVPLPFPKALINASYRIFRKHSHRFPFYRLPKRRNLDRTVTI